MPSSAFAPAIIAGITDMATTVIVLRNQPDYPFRFVVFQVCMFGLALLLATRYRLLWVIAFGVLMCGVVLGGGVGGFPLRSHGGGSGMGYGETVGDQNRRKFSRRRTPERRNLHGVGTGGHEESAESRLDRLPVRTQPSHHRHGSERAERTESQSHACKPACGLELHNA